MQCYLVSAALRNCSQCYLLAVLVRAPSACMPPQLKVALQQSLVPRKSGCRLLVHRTWPACRGQQKPKQRTAVSRPDFRRYHSCKQLWSCCATVFVHPHGPHVCMWPGRIQHTRCSKRSFCSRVHIVQALELAPALPCHLGEVSHNNAMRPCATVARWTIHVMVDLLPPRVHDDSLQRH